MNSIAAPVSAATTARPPLESARRLAPRGSGDAEIRASSTITFYLFLPSVGAPTTCEAIPAESYATLAIISAPTNPPAEIHPDLNLSVRGYVATTAPLTLVDLIGPPSDSQAPQLYRLFGDQRTPTFSTAYRVYDWDWTCNCRGSLISDYEVTLLGMATTPGEIIRVPGSGYDIGRADPLYQVMVLYASSNRLTLKYTREDNVVSGYTLHLENICVEPRLLALYETSNNAGRVRLPALFESQGIGRAIGREIAVAIRDTGAFLDPRSRGDWWRGR